MTAAERRGLRLALLALVLASLVGGTLAAAGLHGYDRTLCLTVATIALVGAVLGLVALAPMRNARGK